MTPNRYRMWPMVAPEVLSVPSPDSDELTLRAWDWRAELERQERSQAWLGRHTDRATSTMNQYANGRGRPSIAWLREAARVLGGPS
jgi:hypothetical protein